MKKAIRKIVRIIAWVLFSIILLLIIVLVLIQLPAVQDFGRKKIVGYLENKLETRVEIGKLDIRFPKKIVLENVYIEDRHKDTLLAAGKLTVDIAMMQLLRSNIEVPYIGIEGLTSHITRLQPDTTFNYQFIADAFATEPDTVAADSAAKPFRFTTGIIELKQARLVYKDDVTGYDAAMTTGLFRTTIAVFDPANGRYAIPELELSDITAKVRQYNPVLTLTPVDIKKDTGNKPVKPIYLQPGHITLKQINVDYSGETPAIRSHVELGMFSTTVDKADLEHLDFQLNATTLESALISYVAEKSKSAMATTKQKKDTVSELNQEPVNWNVGLSSLTIKQDRFIYNDNHHPVTGKGFDPNHIDIDNFSLQANGIRLSPETYSVQLQQLAFREQSGFALQEMKAELRYTDTGAVIKGLRIKSNQSTITTEVTAKWASADMAMKAPGNIYIDAVMDTCRIAMKEVKLFMTFPYAGLNRYANSVIDFRGQARGYLKDLTISSAKLSGIGNSRLQFSGRIKGLPEVSKARYDIRLNSFQTTAADVIAIVPPGMIPENIRIPSTLTATGTFNGNQQAFTTKLTAASTQGNIGIDAIMNTASETYDATCALTNFNAGYVLGQDSLLGLFTATVKAQGRGYNYKTMDGRFEALVQSAGVKGYTYTNVSANGTLQNGKATIQSSANDSNLAFRLDATADLSDTFPAVQANLQLDTINLHALHLFADTLALKTTIAADIRSSNPDAIAGNIDLMHTTLLYQGKRITTDSIQLNAGYADSIQSMQLLSEMAVLDWSGKFSVIHAFPALLHTINQYYSLPQPDTAITKPQQWNATASINPSANPVLQLVPGLTGSEPIEASLMYNSSDSLVDIRVNAPLIRYDEKTIEKIALTSVTEQGRLHYALTTGKADIGATQIESAALTGVIENNLASYRLQLRDKDSIDRVAIAGTIDHANNAYQLKFNPDDFTIDYTPWTVDRDNLVYADSTGFYVNHLNLMNNEQSIKVQSDSTVTGSPLAIVFEHFRIETLTAMANQDTLLLGGTINGSAKVSNLDSTPSLTAGLIIDNLRYKQDTIGNINVSVRNDESNIFATDIRLTGNDNDIQLKGNYYTGESRLDLKLDINTLNMHVLAGLSEGQLKDAGGRLLGNINISGTATQPAINGKLHFDNAYLVPTMLGERFSLPAEDITVDSEGILFNAFTVIDSTGNKAVLNGRVFTTDFRYYTFGLDINADEFSVVNSTKGDNQLFYGKLNIDIGLKIRGDIETPEIDGVLNVNKSTDFNFTLPGEDPEVVNREGVVNFIDVDAPEDSVVLLLKDTLTTFKALAGLDLSLNITTDTAAQFTVVIDERNGDAIRLKGKADLAGGIDKSGKLSLAGLYELQQGSYQITLSLLKKNFIIQKGSTLNWAGDPMSAMVNITAIYEIRTAPIDFMQAELSGESESEVNKYKEKLPFKVLLIIKGDLLQPEISFDITLPADLQTKWDDVEAKLKNLRTNESELNKQVFALLLLGRFVQENPMDYTVGGSYEGMVRESVSRLLTDQINNLAGSLVKGVDLNIALTSEEEYTSGEKKNQTDLTVGVSKSLLNDRLKVNVGSNFLLEGANENQATSNIAGDVQIDYQLTEDGRYRVRTYRKNEYESAVEGQIVETGISFILTVDYDYFREIFSRKNKKSGKQ